MLSATKFFIGYLTRVPRKPRPAAGAGIEFHKEAHFALALVLPLSTAAVSSYLSLSGASLLLTVSSHTSNDHYFQCSMQSSAEHREHQYSSALSAFGRREEQYTSDHSEPVPLP